MARKVGKTRKTSDAVVGLATGISSSHVDRVSSVEGSWAAPRYSVKPDKTVRITQTAQPLRHKVVHEVAIPSKEDTVKRQVNIARRIMQRDIVAMKELAK